MPTLKAVILKNKDKDKKVIAKADGTFSIKIRLTHKRQAVYISTPYTVGKDYLTKELNIKSPQLKTAVAAIVAAYEAEFMLMGLNIYKYNAAELKKHLVDKFQKTDNGRIDFIKFGRDHILKIQGEQKKTSAMFTTTLNNLVVFFGSDKVYFEDITGKSLAGFQNWLQYSRSIKYKNSKGEEQVRELKPVSNSSIKRYMADIATLFKIAKEEYNDTEKNQIKISHNPFDKYKLPEISETKERALEPAVIRQIQAFPDYDNNLTGLRSGTNRINLGRDVFMLIIYLLGINTADLYSATRLEKGRLIYNRTKTKGKRQDTALMSIKIPDVALALLDLYRDKTGKRVFKFYQLYKDANEFNRAIGKGLKVIAEALGLENLTSYYARHSFATIARNDCGFSLEDVAEAMNHSVGKYKITDIYIKKTWDRVDRIQAAVLEKIKD